MKELNKLVEIINTRIRGNITMLDLTGEIEDPSKEQQLYNGILAGEYETDEDAAEHMYDTDPTDQRFRMLKSRLRQKLYNLLYYVDFKDSKLNPVFQYEQECFDYVHKARILFKNGEFDMAEKQINKALAVSRDAEFNKITVECLEIFRAIFSDQCKPTDLSRVIDEMKGLRTVICDEEEAMDLYANQRMLLNKSLHSRRNNVDSTKEVVDQLEELWKRSGSYNIFEIYYKLNILYHELRGDFREIITITAMTDEMLSKRQLNKIRFDTRFNHFIRTYAHLRDGDYVEGMESAIVGKKHIDKASRNWFAHMENYFLLAMHSKDYNLAGNIVDEVEENSFINKLTPPLRAKWKLYRGYANLLTPGKQASDGLRFEKLKQKCQPYKKSHRILYTSVLLLEVLDLVKKGKYESVGDVMSGLELYFFEYLNDPGKNPREKLLFKLLRLMIESFDAEELDKKGKKYADKLVEKTPDDPMSEPELIPYEVLWQEVLQLIRVNQS